MNAQTEKVPRRKRKAPPRRIPAVIEQRERKPFLFGWGTDLTQREREAVKERIALFGGIGLALVLVLIIGWGWYQDNIAGPAAVQAENNKPVAQVGNYTVTMGYFKRFEKLQNTQLNNQLTQIQQQISLLQSQPNGAKKNAAQISQLESQQSIIQQQLGSLASGSLQALIDNRTILQRSSTAGVKNDAKVRNDAMTQLMRQAGGKLHLQQSIAQSGMTESEISDLVTAQALQTKIQKALASHVSRYQIKVRASHILIPTKKKALAEQLYQKVLHGANFAALAKKYSTDPGSAKQGGDLGYFTHGSMVAPFDKAAFSMKVGQIRLIQSQYGWHIIRVTGRKNARLTNTEYQQSQQSAYTTWLAKQEALLHVQRYYRPEQLPGVSSTPTTNNVPTQLQPSSGASSGQVTSGQTSGQSGQVQVNPSSGSNSAPLPGSSKNSKSSSSTKKP